ncbi:MAG: hypothetical protein ACRDT9_06180 [Agromyces sp.]
MSMHGSFIVPATLADSADYLNWTGGDTKPPQIDQTLRSCTGLVLDASLGVLYDVDPATGLATDTAVRAALRDATCIQAAAWVALKIDPATGGVQTSNVKRSKRIGSASVEYADTATAAAARAVAYTSLVPEAERFLQQRNLLGTQPFPLG